MATLQTSFLGRVVSVQRPSLVVAPRVTRRSHSLKLCVRAAAEQSSSNVTTTPPTASAASSSSVEYVKDDEFAISKVSFGSILTPLGVFLLTYGFGAYFTFLPGGDLSSLMLVYGFPLSLLGFALSYAQLEPVPLKTTKAAFDLRPTQMTDIQKQLREDVTRFRYGDEQHLDEALNKIFKFGRSTGVPKKFTPLLRGVREETTDGRYQLILEFKSALDIAKWQEFQPRVQTFFGPGLDAVITTVEGGVDVFLTTDGSGKGMDGKVQKDVMIPLLPGLPARRRDDSVE